MSEDKKKYIKAGCKFLICALLLFAASYILGQYYVTIGVFVFLIAAILLAAAGAEFGDGFNL